MTGTKGLGVLLLMGAALTSLSGCSFFKGLTNPDVAWAVGEPATMSVIVRRAELAEGIADEVERLMLETPVDEAAEEALKLTEADLQKHLDAAATAPTYEGQPLRVVPAEAWLPTLASTCAEDGGHDTLAGMLEGEVEALLGEVTSQGRQLAVLNGKVEQAEKRRDADDTDETIRQTAQKEIDALDDRIAALEESYEPKVNELLAEVRKNAAAVPDKAKQRMIPIVLNLLEAVEDARIANDAAMVRYPMAVPSITTDLQQAATRFVADVIEEQTGHRPATKGIAPDIALEGTDVKLSLNGVPAEALGDLEMGDLVSEVSDRTQAYAGRAFTLLADTSATEDRLAFQADLLEAWRDGMAATPGTEGHVDITDLEVAAKPATANASHGKGEADPAPRRSVGGLAITHCASPGAPAVADAGTKKASPAAAASKTGSKKAPGKASPRTPPRQTASSASAPGDTKWIDLPAGGDGPMLESP